jgi:hypothetical protein
MATQFSFTIQKGPRDCSYSGVSAVADALVSRMARVVCEPVYGL